MLYQSGPEEPEASQPPLAQSTPNVEGETLFLNYISNHNFKAYQ